MAMVAMEDMEDMVETTIARVTPSLQEKTMGKALGKLK